MGSERGDQYICMYIAYLVADCLLIFENTTKTPVGYLYVLKAQRFISNRSNQHLYVHILMLYLYVDILHYHNTYSHNIVPQDNTKAS